MNGCVSKLIEIDSIDIPEKMAEIEADEQSVKNFSNIS